MRRHLTKENFVPAFTKKKVTYPSGLRDVGRVWPGSQRMDPDRYNTTLNLQIITSALLFWIIIFFLSDFPTSGKEAENLCQLGVLPTHAIRIIVNEEEEMKDRKYKWTVFNWMKIYKFVPVVVRLFYKSDSEMKWNLVLLIGEKQGVKVLVLNQQNKITWGDCGPWWKTPWNHRDSIHTLINSENFLGVASVVLF